MLIKPIRTEADYSVTMAEINLLSLAEPGTEEFDRLDVLITLVEAYEEKISPVPLPDPIEAILFNMERLGLSRRDLEPYIGGSGRVSEILNRERRLTLSMIRQLSEALRIPIAALAQEYPLRQKAA